MKKKLRLLTTIASISLALGLMVFGILAATNVTVGVSSTVTYTAEGIAFKLYGTVELLSAKPTGTASSVSDSEANLLANVNIQSTGTETATLADKEFTESNRWVVMTFTVKNKGSNVIGTINVAPTAADSNVEATTDSEEISANLAYGQEITFRVYYYLKNIYQSITDGTTNTAITFEKVLPPPEPVREVALSVSWGDDYGYGNISRHKVKYSTDNGETWVAIDETVRDYSTVLIGATQIKFQAVPCGSCMKYRDDDGVSIDGVLVIPFEVGDPWYGGNGVDVVMTENILIDKASSVRFQVSCDY